MERYIKTQYGSMLQGGGIRNYKQDKATRTTTTYLSGIPNKQNATTNGYSDYNGKSFPFWDYRSVRPENQLLHEKDTYSHPSDDESYSNLTSDMDDVSSVFSDVTTGIDDVISYTTSNKRKIKTRSTPRKTQRDQDQDDRTSISSSDLASLSLSDNESLSTSQVEKMCLHLHCDGRREEYVRQLYQSLFDWVDPTGEVYSVINETDLPRGYGCNDKVPTTTDVQSKNCEIGLRINGFHKAVVEIPSLAIVLFLREDSMVGSERVDMASTIFEKEPWKFHHSESISRGKIGAYPYNNQNYYTAGPNDPLCAIRQIHCGKQHVRLVRFTSIDTWQDQINLYSLILGQEPEVRNADFCLFTATSYGDYDVQLALKKVPKDIKCKTSSGSALGFKVSQVGNLVPLLPQMCNPVSDSRWRTTDLDGNVIYLDIMKPSRDSDSGVSTSYPLHSTPYSKADKIRIRTQRKNKHKTKAKTVYKIYSGDESDSTSVGTDLDAFMKSVLQPLMENSRSKTPSVCSSTDSVKSEDKTSQVSESSAKSSIKSVRFNKVVDYRSDCGYPSDTDQEEDDSGINLNGNDTENCRSPQPPTSAVPPKNGHYYGEDTDEESYFSEAGIDVDFHGQPTKSSPVEVTVRPKNPPPYRPPPPHPNAQKVTLGFYI